MTGTDTRGDPRGERPAVLARSPSPSEDALARLPLLYSLSPLLPLPPHPTSPAHSSVDDDDEHPTDNMAGPPSHSLPDKKQRIRHSDSQLAALNSLYEHDEHPSLDVRARLALDLGMYVFVLYFFRVFAVMSC